MKVTKSAKFLAIILFAFNLTTNAQELTISNTGQIGTSGDNWSTSGTNPVTITASGTANVNINTSVILGYLNNGTSVIVQNNNSNSNLVIGSTLTKSAGGDATLTLRADKQVVVASPISSTSSKINIILWSDYNNSNVGGVALAAAAVINTNGGHFWAGGSSTAAGSYTWNGLTVGNGPSVGSSGANHYAMDFFTTLVNTNGGDILLWSGTGNGSVLDGIGMQNNPHLNAGSGNVTLITRQIFNVNNTLSVTTTGKLALATDASNPWTSDFNWATTTSGSNVTLTSALGRPLQINNFSTLGGLSVGVYDGFGSAFNYTNLQNVNINSSINIPGAINVYAGGINYGVGVYVTASTANGTINFQAKSGFSTVANTVGDTRGKLMTTGGGDITVNADADNNNSGELNIDWLTIDGTNGDILLEGSTFSWNTGAQETLPEFYSNLGTLTIRNVTSSNYQIETNWIAMFGTFGGVTLGREGGTSGVFFNSCTVCHSSALNYGTSAFQIAGPITAFGGNIYANFNLRSTISGSDILLKADKHIVVGENVAVQSNNGDITFWSNSNGVADATDGDFIGIYSGVSINSANGSTSQTSGGGTITMAGGNTSEVLPSGTVVPTAYAYSSRTTNWGPLLPPGGVNFGYSTAANGQVNSLSIYSGGGNIVIKGKSNSSSAGIQWFSGSAGATQIINSGVGTILFDGLATSNNAHGIEFMSYASVVSPTIISSNTSSTAIRIKGETSSTLNRSGYQGTVKLEANGLGGGIEVNGKVPSSSNYPAIKADTLNAYALSGPITFISDGGLGLTAGGTWGKGTLASSSSNITLRSDKIALSTSTIQTSGTVTVEPLGTTFTSAVTFPNTNLTISNTVTGLTLGKSTNTANITFANATTIAGPVTVYADYIIINENLNTTAGTINGDVLLKSLQRITIAASKSITTNGGDVVLWSDSDNSGAGQILINDNVTINTINGSTSSNLSGGGKIILAGGLDTNLDGIPDSTANSATGNGVKIGSTTSNISEFYSGGGDIFIRGSSTRSLLTDVVNNIGVYQLGKFTANSGTGALTISGQSTNFYGVNFVEAVSDVTTGATHLSLISNKALGTAISINGTSSTTDGVRFNDNNPKEILATGGGAITITGTGAGSGYGIFLQNQDILATSGAITLNGGTKGIYTANAGMNLGSKVGSTITSSSSDISLISDSFLFDNTSNLKTSGKIILESNANSFLTPLTFPINNLQLSTNISGLTLGKSTNTANVTLASATSIAGPITVYGGKISANDDLSVSTSDPIQLIASKDIEAASGADISTQGGAIILSSNSDDASGGGILMTGSTVKSNGGAITLGGGTDGSNYAEGSAFGVVGPKYRGLWLHQTTIDGTGSTANGNIVIRGKGWQGANWTSPSNDDYAIGVDIVTSSIIKTGGNATVYIDGIGGKNNNLNTHAVGINFYNGPQIYTASGSLSIIGTAGTGSARQYAGILMDGGDNPASIYSSSGSISLTGNTASSSVKGIKTNQGVLNVGWIGTNTPTTGAITLNADAFSFNNDYALNLKTTGLLTVQSVNDSFANTLTFPITNLTLSNDISGLTLGKATNSANITFENATTIAGPITAYGGTITLNANLTTTNNGSISLFTDNTLGGITSGRTLTAAGAFKYIPLGTSFAADVTYPITNLTATSTGLTIGKTNNTKNITINQAVTGAAGIELYGNNLNINANLKTTSGANMYLKGNSTIASNSYIESNGNFTHDGNLVFKSDGFGTAAFGTLGGLFTKVSGTTTVERYIPAKRAWRLLTAPLKREVTSANANTVSSNWQGVNGEGLLLFSPNTYQSQTMTGYTTGGGMPNIWNYNNGWVKIPNISSETMFGSNNSDAKAFLVFATGPQGSTNIVTGETATTLKPKGDLISGNVSYSLTADQYNLIANPYACPIDTHALIASNVGSKIWTVDPGLGTIGGYYAYDGIDWAPNIPSDDLTYIQSGQGFFVKSTNTTFNISETHKETGLLGNSFILVRTANNKTTENKDKIRILLHKKQGNDWKLADGILAVNAATGNNDLDGADTQKMSNFNENIMFKNGTTNLSIEYSALPQVGQVQPMFLTGTTAQPYQLQVYTEGYSNATVSPFLQDTTTGTFTAIPTNGTILTVPFTGIATTSTSPDQRFKIVYQSALNSDDFTSAIASVYPNPVTNNVVNIQLKSVTENTEFIVTNLLGQTVHKGTLNTIQNAITLPEVQEGMYMITVKQEGKKFTTKLYIQ